MNYGHYYGESIPEYNIEEKSRFILGRFGGSPPVLPGAKVNGRCLVLSKKLVTRLLLFPTEKRDGWGLFGYGSPIKYLFKPVARSSSKVCIDERNSPSCTYHCLSCGIRRISFKENFKEFILACNRPCKFVGDNPWGAHA